MSERKAKGMPSLKRRSVNVDQGQFIASSTLQPNQPLPLVLQPTVEGVDPIAWASNQRDWIEAQALTHGGLLFRGFDLKTVEAFERFVGAVSGGALRYQERSSPRSQVSGNIYTSTDHPADQSIYLHNEQSYNLTFPLRIFFFCVTPATEGGETPIADTRRIFARLDPAIRERFIHAQYQYVRNFGDGFGLSWQAAFQAEDRGAVEAYCRDNGIACEWKNDGRLRTRQVRRAVARHPRSNELAWFNHLTFFNVSTLDPAVQARLRAAFRDEELPNNTFYGDGAPIEPEVLAQLHAAYEAETVAFPWQKGDLLMLDNMLVAHGRSPYAGPRKVVVAMSEPWRWDDVAVTE